MRCSVVADDGCWRRDNDTPLALGVQGKGVPDTLMVVETGGPVNPRQRCGSEMGRVAS
jgi:hypothetical protein